MSNIDIALAASKEALDQLIAATEQASAWSVARVPGKWSPSQIVEHVARSLEESANMASGRPSKFPTLPAIVRPVVRALFFTRVLRKAAFPKSRTNKAMNPASGPDTPQEARVRLEQAHEKFNEICRHIAAHEGWMPTTIFGAVRVEDYVRFTELHTRHHTRQMKPYMDEASTVRQGSHVPS